MPWYSGFLTDDFDRKSRNESRCHHRLRALSTSAEATVILLEIAGRHKRNAHFISPPFIYVNIMIIDDFAVSSRQSPQMLQYAVLLLRLEIACVASMLYCLISSAGTDALPPVTRRNDFRHCALYRWLSQALYLLAVTGCWLCWQIDALLCLA